MPTFVGVVVGLAILVCIGRGIWFLLKIGRHVSRDLSAYANAEPYNRKDHVALTPRPPREKVLITDEERAYFAAHVPESAKTDPRRSRT